MDLVLSDLVAGTVGLKVSEGHGRLGPSGLAGLGYALAFYFLAQSLKYERRLRERLDALRAGPSMTKQAGAVGTALLKGVGGMARTDKPGKNARDGFLTEHMEIASYQLLERLAKRAGDAQTAEVARQNRADEEAMAQKINPNWDKFLDLTLKDAGIPA
jgi:ferritin-like metal-binding protein YciE